MRRECEVVLEIVEHIIAHRREKHRYPECALFREIQENIAVPAEDLRAVLAELVATGHLTVHPTQNDQSYYIHGT